MISAVIITLNEERNIERCLESLQNVVEEIIVVDSFSTDSTKDICKKYDARFVQKEWEGYGNTKNYGNSLAKHPYIFSIDADESLSDDLKQSILKVKGSLKGVYNMNRLTNYCGKWIRHSGWFPDWHIRLFPKDKVKWNTSEVHEELIMHSDLPKHKLDGLLFHYSYYSADEHWERAGKYAELAAMKIQSAGIRFLWTRQYLNSFLRFMRMYFFQLGFMDGKAGWQISRISAWEVKQKYRLARLRSKDAFVNP
jgi:glycosyltransferase involved in cell wall biosynthesis